MKRLALLLAFALPAAGQAIVENFLCRTAVSAGNGNPTVLTCNEPHGYSQRPAVATLSFGSTPVQAGLTVTIDGLAYTFVSAVDNSSPRQILVSSSKVENAKRLAAAINDSGEGKGTLYSSLTTAHPTVYTHKPTYAAQGMQINTAADTVTWKAHGMQTGDSFIVTCSNAGLATAVPPFQFYTTYYAIRVDADTLRVATSLANAQANIYLDLTTAQGGNFVGIQASCAGCAPEWVSDTASVSLLVVSHITGLAGAGKPVSSSATAQAAWNRSTMQAVFPVRITGASGTWAGLGSDTAPKGWIATLVSDTVFSVPFNSTSAGLFAGQDIRIWAGNGDLGAKIYTDNSTGSSNVMRISANHALAFAIPGCTQAMNEVECSKGYWSPDNQKAYMDDSAIASFVVSGSTITINLKAPYADANTYDPMAVGQLIHIRGYQQYATSTNPGYDGTPNAPAQSAASLMAKGSTRGFRVVTFSADRKTITIQNPGLADGTYAGTCLPAGACVGRTQADPFIAITWKASPYLYTNARSGGYLWPVGYEWWNTKNPAAFDPGSNRFRYWVKFGKNIAGPSTGAYNFNWGTYPQTVSEDTQGAGSHFYHYMTLNTYQDQWQLMEFNCAPSHEVGAGGGVNWPNEMLKGHGYYPAWRVGGRSCMEGETVFYQDSVAGKADWSGETLYYAGLEFDRVDEEPDDAVRGRSAVWSPRRFVNGVLTDSPGYDVMWTTPTVIGTSYQIRYSTTASLKTAGWSSGLDGGTVSPPGIVLSYSGALWQSPEMPQADDFWVGIRPVYPVAGTTGAGASPIWVITRSETSLSAGDTVRVSDVAGNTVLNALTSTVVDSAPRRYFWRFRPQREHGWSLPGELAGIDAASGRCTARFTVEHGLPAGWVFEVAGSSSIALGASPSFTPKLYTIESVPDAYSAIFSCPQVADGTYAQDYAPDMHMVLIALPGLAFAGSGNGAYTGGGTLVSTGEKRGFAEVHLPRYQPYGSVPQAPLNLAASTSGTQVTLNWQDASSDETDFLVERKSPGGEFQTVTVAGENATTFTDIGLTPGTALVYRVEARNAVGESAWSNEVSITVSVPVVLPGTPTSVRASAVLSDQLRLDWDDSPENIDYFEVEADSGSGYKPVGEVDGGTNFLMVTGLTPSTTYHFRVRSANSQNTSDWGISSGVTTLAGVVWRIGRRSRTAALVDYHSADGQSCTLTGPGGPFTDEGGPAARVGLLTNLAPGAVNSFSILCPGASASGQVETPAAADGSGGDVAWQVVATAPGLAGLDNLVVQTGDTPQSLAPAAGAPCTAGRCTVTLSSPSGQPLWVRYSWCANRATDSLCQNPANELGRSAILPVIP